MAGKYRVQSRQGSLVAPIGCGYLCHDIEDNIVVSFKPSDKLDVDDIMHGIEGMKEVPSLLGLIELISPTGESATRIVQRAPQLSLQRVRDTQLASDELCLAVGELERRLDQPLYLASDLINKGDLWIVLRSPSATRESVAS